MSKNLTSGLLGHLACSRATAPASVPPHCRRLLPRLFPCQISNPLHAWTVVLEVRIQPSLLLPMIFFVPSCSNLERENRQLDSGRSHGGRGDGRGVGGKE